MGEAGWDEDGPIEAYSVSPGMPAQKAGIEAGDIAADHRRTAATFAFTFLDSIRQSGGKPVVDRAQP